MHLVSITIQSLKDAAEGKNRCLPKEEAKNLREAQLKIQILEAGTTGGQTTLSFVMTGEDGKHYIGQMTGNQFESLIAAFRGADARFKDGQA